MKLSRGFTIIELIISIFILSVAVVGIFSAFSMVVILTSDAADRLTATYLAQEGMETARNIRDINWLNMDQNPGTASWVDGLTAGGINNGIDCTQGCEADYESTRMSPWVDTDYLKIDSSQNGSGFYNYTSGTDTKFKRKIIITCLPDKDCTDTSDYIIKVVVQVSWNQKATILNPYNQAGTGVCPGSNCIASEETLYDWYNYLSSQPVVPPPGQ
ncbi:MAG: prepilin-type N-terminal cleavage/methylation domain-containing protein [Candidatus Staskawiczbacteria bacterium]|jgi:prepilin-type N-terminal cleavage/methylation domain-containing protein